MAKSSVILEYLQHIGAGKEAEMYLKLFKGVEQHRFAIIAIDAQALAVYGRDVAAALAYLSSLGLTPIVVHNATGALGKQLVSDIWSNNGKCQAIMAGLYTGEAKAAKAKELIGAGTIPVIETENAAATLKQLLQAIKPGKLVFLNKSGGVKTRKGELLSYINLPNEYEMIRKTAAAEYDDVLKTASNILADADWKLHIEIVPPNGLLTELFTIKGSGTFVKKGPKIMQLSSSKADKKKVKKVLEESFSKKLNGSYFSSGNAYFVEENYNGVAVVKEVNGMHYIDKIAVLPEVQGEGLARDLITSIMNSCHKVFWRAKPENHINEWYFKLCSGMQKISNWHVYWSNLNVEEIKGAIRYAAEKPTDFIG